MARRFFSCLSSCQLDGYSYVLREIYGIEQKDEHDHNEDEDDDAALDEARECVVGSMCVMLLGLIDDRFACPRAATRSCFRAVTCACAIRALKFCDFRFAFSSRSVGLNDDDSSKANKCPICRATFHSLLQLRVAQKSSVPVAPEEHVRMLSPHIIIPHHHPYCRLQGCRQTTEQWRLSMRCSRSLSLVSRPAKAPRLLQMTSLRP